MYSEVLRVLGRAVDDDDEVELLLLHSLKTTIEFNPAVGTAVLRLGERAFELGRMIALASITAALCSVTTWTFRHRSRRRDGSLASSVLPRPGRLP